MFFPKRNSYAFLIFSTLFCSGAFVTDYLSLGIKT
jgi:hypothetical protein